MKDKNIIILGGGSAGWLTALFAQRTFPNNSITLIESKKIGILGAGEGSTPHLPGFLKQLGINPLDLLIKTGGTIKQGISFENWNGDNKKYFHGFSELNQLGNYNINNIFGSDCSDYYLKHLIKNNLDFDEHLYAPYISYKNKVDLERVSYALHFDAHSLAEYLKNIGVDRGIKLIDGDYKNLQQINGDITKIILQDGREFNTDFVFDCTGFARLLIGEYYKSKWIDYQKYLPIKKAIPFFLKREYKEITPYTQAIAMKYGWVWKIPLQHRFGAGYIFDSDYINEEQALEEAEQLFGRKLEVPKVIPFTAGRYEDVWINNCLSIGLSSGFTEPLEATSLFLTVKQLELLRHYVSEMNDSSLSKENYNKTVGNNADEMMYFLYLHYLTERKDSPFWSEFKEKHPTPPGFVSLLEKLKQLNVKYFDFEKQYVTGNFPLNAHLIVGKGLNLFNSKINISGYEELNPTVFETKERMIRYEKQSLYHSEVLNDLSIRK